MTEWLIQGVVIICLDLMYRFKFLTMRNKTRLIALAISILMFSCEKSSFLNRIPMSFTTAENYYKSIKDFEAAITGCYEVINTQFIGNVNVLNGTYSSGLQYILSAGTDELIMQASAGGQLRDHFGIASVDADHISIESLWKAYFAGIMRCNVLLDMSSTVDFVDSDNNRLKEIVAEARFLRAFYYFHLAALYGGVPMFTTADMDATATRATLEDVYNNIILPDLRFSYQNLSKGAYSYSANKWSAGGYLGVVLNYLASCKRNNVGAELNFELNSFNWVDADACSVEAKSVLKDVVDNSGYVLISNYDYLFRESTKAAQKQECLFVADNATAITDSYPDISFVFCPQGVRNTFGGSFGTQIPPVELYQSYSAALDKRLRHNITGALNASSVKETVEGASYYVPNVSSGPTFANNKTGKYRHVDPATKTIPLWASGISVPLLRFADVLLQYAEALYFTGNEASARSYFDGIRQRSLIAGKSLNEINTAYYKSDFVTELLDERKRELCYESKRRLDLIRFGRLTSAIMSLTPSATGLNTRVKDLQANWKDYKIWLPIPTREIRLNNNLVPNPGY